MDLQELLLRLLKAKLDVGATGICWREIIGNGFGLASALLGMRRKVAAWPIGIVGNILLFTVFIGGASETPSTHRRSSICGARRAARCSSSWSASTAGCGGTGSSKPTAPRASGYSPSGPARPGGFSCWSEPSCCGCAFYFILKALGSWGPAADAWILTGSILATYGMARGWVEFWLIWIAVDAVGVPLLLVAGYYPSAIMYIIYGAFCVIGFISWLKIERRERAEAQPAGVADPVIETVG